jgi:hypothetical protein
MAHAELGEIRKDLRCCGEVEVAMQLKAVRRQRRLGRHDQS